METDDQDLKRMLGLRASRESRIIVLLRQGGGEMYSVDFSDVMEIQAPTAAGVLRQMEKKGLLVSRLVRSPEDFGNGLGRRYYRLPTRRAS